MLLFECSESRTASSATGDEIRIHPGLPSFRYSGSPCVQEACQFYFQGTRNLRNRAFTDIVLLPSRILFVLLSPRNTDQLFIVVGGLY